MAEMILKATGSKLQIISAIHVTSTQAQYDTCLFEFDEAWDGYGVRTAVFYSNPNNIKAMLLDGDNKCYIPWDAFSASRYLYIGVYGSNGESYLPTQFVEVMYQPGANVDDHLYPPTPGIYEQIISQLNETNTSLNIINNSINECEEKINLITSYATKTSLFTGDDNERLESAINDAIEHNNVLIVDEPLTITRQMNIPSSIVIDGCRNTIYLDIENGTGISITGSDVTFSNIILDGNNKTAIIARVLGASKNVFFENVDFTHGYSSIDQACGLRVDDGAKNIHIDRCTFKNIEALEDGAPGNGPGSARGVLFLEVEMCSVRNSCFDMIGGFEDGDSVHIQSAGTIGNWSRSDVVIDNNRFYNITKRGVKLQASNCLVTNNKFYSTFKVNEDGGAPLSAISDYGNNNTIINNDVQFIMASRGIDVQNTTGSVIKCNRIEIDSARQFDTATIVHDSRIASIYFTSSNSLVVHDNIFIGNGMKIYATQGSSDLVSIERNTFYPPDGGRQINITAAKTSRLTIDNNRFLSTVDYSPYETIVLTNPENAKIANNYFEKTYYILRLYGELSNVFVYPNTVVDAQANDIIRTTDVTSGIATLLVDGQNTAGRVTIPSGSTQVSVNHLIGRIPQMVVCTPASFVVGPWSVNFKSSTSGFFIDLQQTQATEVKFDWYAIS